MEVRREPLYGWVMVGLGALMTCMAVGAMFSLAVFLAPMAASTGWSRTAISSAMTLNFLAMGIGGFAWGTLSDRFGPRPVLLAGAVLLGLGLVLSARAASVWQFQVAWGIVVGGATGSFFAPMISVVSSWFERRRSLAVALVSVGVGVAPMTLSPFAAWLLSVTDWRHAELVLAALAWATLIPAAFFVRPAPQAGAASATGPTGRAAVPKDALPKALRSPQFVVLAATFFACCAAHSGPIFHTVSFAMGCGIPTMAAVTIYSMEGVGGLVGRVVFGLLGDRFGARRALVFGLLVQAIGAGAYMFASRLPDFYVVATVFGFAYGGVMPLYAVIARDYFGQHILASVFGAAALVSSLGMALGPWIGGWIFDTFHSYKLLYIGSFAVGLGAVGIALLFPRGPAGEPTPAAA
ncbi:MAG TPA: MFS transporter [Usitatibacter sp.]|nr:MFS transporter [Usitatibacter sp.]